MTPTAGAGNERRSVPGGGDVCSADHAGFLSTPLRRLLHNPRGILKGAIRQGDTVADLGCGPGFFTLPMAEMVGPKGHVIAVDLQPAMLEKLERRAARQGLAARIRTQRCEVDTIGQVKPVDFALAFFMVHEVPDVAGFLAEARHILKPGGRLLLVEPKGHVSAPAFEETVRLARVAGLEPVSNPRILMSRAVLLERRHG